MAVNSNSPMRWLKGRVSSGSLILLIKLDSHKNSKNVLLQELFIGITSEFWKGGCIGQLPSRDTDTVTAQLGMYSPP